MTLETLRKLCAGPPNVAFLHAARTALPWLVEMLREAKAIMQDESFIDGVPRSVGPWLSKLAAGWEPNNEGRPTP